MSTSGSTSAPSASGAPPTSGTPTLPTDREPSTIPSSNGTWYYPSPHQFYRATVQKGHNVKPDDMEMVVAIHNAVNEKAWSEIMRFEEAHHGHCKEVKLIRFLGRPGDLSPKANFFSYLGREEPFDRHDWFVDRCGEPVRYVVDFYDGERRGRKQLVSMYIDARPALDSFSAFWDRVKQSFKEGKLC